MESPITFGEWLRQSREGLRLTREEFAGRVGCSISALRKFEDGQRRPSSQIAELMANCLNIPSSGRSTFVKAARGELSVERLSPVSKLIASPNISPASMVSKNNLPILPTPLIGRQREVDELTQLLRDPQCRLLTLVGPGGIGKTRLAIEIASRVQVDFADGVYFISLAPVTSTRFFVPVIADAVGFAFRGSNPSDPKTQLFGYLKEKQILLLADNLEHLLAEPGIELLAEFLANAPQVKLIATSRESLGFLGEWVFEVKGLPIPESGNAENTSMELFLQRARRAHVGFNATPEDYPAILRICQLVEGMPLGIELAAAWVRTLACEEIADQIERGLDFLNVSARDLPARHRSMRAVFDHSWKLLTEDEQGVLLRLSVFKGGFRREAAEQIAGATLSIISTLMTKSLVRRSGTERYDLHELIRQFALDRLAEKPKVQKDTQKRHAHYYLKYFGSRDARLRSSEQRETLAELTVEMDNFRTAWDWAISSGEFALVEQTLRTFVMLYDTRGWYQEGIDTLDRAATALEITHAQSLPDRMTQVALGHILASRSLLASRLGQYEQAQAMLERSLEILRPLNELRVLVEPLYSLGTVMELTGTYARALELYSEGLEIATAIGDRWFAALCLTCCIGLVGITQMIVKPEITYERLQSVLSEWRAIGDPRFTAIGLNSLYWSALRLGRYKEARAALEESIELSMSVGDRWVLGFTYRGLGIVAQAQSEQTKAVEMFRKSLDIFTELGACQDVARALADMSRSIFALGNDAEAGRGWHESLRIAMETRGIFIALEALVGLASLQAKHSDMEHALELLLIVLNHPVVTHETRKRAAQLLAELEEDLTSSQIKTIQAHAAERTFEEIVEGLLR